MEERAAGTKRDAKTNSHRPNETRNMVERGAASLMVVNQTNRVDAVSVLVFPTRSRAPEKPSLGPPRENTAHLRAQRTIGFQSRDPVNESSSRFGLIHRQCTLLLFLQEKIH